MSFITLGLLGAKSTLTEDTSPPAVVQITVFPTWHCEKPPACPRSGGITYQVSQKQCIDIADDSHGFSIKRISGCYETNFIRVTTFVQKNCDGDGIPVRLDPHYDQACYGFFKKFLSVKFDCWDYDEFPKPMPGKPPYPGFPGDDGDDGNDDDDDDNDDSGDGDHEL